MEHHGASLRAEMEGRETGEEETENLLRELSREGSEAGLANPDRTILRYARKLTRTPAAISAGDVEDLRAAGFDDRAIHDICCISAYFNFVNRIADGLGVELEDRFLGPKD